MQSNVLNEQQQEIVAHAITHSQPVGFCGTCDDARRIALEITGGDASVIDYFEKKYAEQQSA